ncbi:MAG: isopentenyl phosphate kinase [Candidatus Aenigmarchaeota archaeon]|nr:isopentenyl phosphate kinase [Candidatus Aenigmarchaeota archaeon]
MKNLFFVKLGGSLITDKSRPFTEKPDVIRRLASEIHNARKKGLKIVIGHGGGSYPHEPATKYQTHKGLISKESTKGLALVQDAASRLNRIVVKALLDAGENAISVQPSSFCIAKNIKIVDGYTKPIEKMLESGMLPVVYGDVGMDLGQGCCILSTEEIFSFLAKTLKPERIIMAGKVDGVFTADPNNDKSAKIIPEITQKNFPRIKKYLTSSDGIDVTGGMLHKVELCLDLAKTGAQCEIMNGLNPGNLEKALSGQRDLGTVIKAV